MPDRNPPQAKLAAMDITAIAASGIQASFRSAGNFAAAILRDGAAGAGTDIAGDVVGMVQAGNDLRAELAVFKAGESMNKRLLDILA